MGKGSHRHQWLPGMPGFENCVSCGAKRPSRAQPAAVSRGLPQDRQPPKHDPFGSSFSERLFKALKEEEAERLRQVQEREESIKALLSRPIMPIMQAAELQKIAEAMSKIGTTTEAASEGFRNSWVSDPTPEEALQVIFDYLEFVADEKGVDGLRTVAGIWMSKVTNGISDIVRKHEDKEGG